MTEPGTQSTDSGAPSTSRWATFPAASTSSTPKAQIVVVCHHGIRSANVASFLASRGFESVINLHGGIDAWSRTVDPGVPVY